MATLWDLIVSYWDMRLWYAASQSSYYGTATATAIQLDDGILLVADNAQVVCGQNTALKTFLRAAFPAFVRCQPLRIQAAGDWVNGAAIAYQDLKQGDAQTVLEVLNRVLDKPGVVVYADPNNYDKKDRGGHYGRYIQEYCRDYGCAVVALSGSTQWSFIEFLTEDESQRHLQIQPHADAPKIPGGQQTMYSEGRLLWATRLPIIIPPVPFRFKNSQSDVSRVVVWGKTSTDPDEHIAYFIVPLDADTASMLGFT